MESDSYSDSEMTLTEEHLNNLSKLYSNSNYTFILFKPILHKILSAMVYVHGDEDISVIDHSNGISTLHNLEHWELIKRFHFVRNKDVPLDSDGNIDYSFIRHLAVCEID